MLTTMRQFTNPPRTIDWLPIVGKMRRMISYFRTILIALVFAAVVLAGKQRLLVVVADLQCCGDDRAS